MKLNFSYPHASQCENIWATERIEQDLLLIIQQGKIPF